MSYINEEFDKCDVCGKIYKAGCDGYHGNRNNGEDFCTECLSNRVCCASCGDGFYWPEELTENNLCPECASKA